MEFYGFCIIVPQDSLPFRVVMISAVWITSILWMPSPCTTIIKVHPPVGCNIIWIYTRLGTSIVDINSNVPFATYPYILICNIVTAFIAQIRFWWSSINVTHLLPFTLNIANLISSLVKYPMLTVLMNRNIHTYRTISWITIIGIIIINGSTFFRYPITTYINIYRPINFCYASSSFDTTRIICTYIFSCTITHPWICTVIIKHWSDIRPVSGRCICIHYEVYASSSNRRSTPATTIIAVII